MPQVINAVSKNADFIMLHSYNTDTSILSPVIQSIPTNEFSHSLLAASDESTKNTLIIKRQEQALITIESTEAYVMPFDWYYFNNGVLENTATDMADLLYFFLNP